MPSDSTGAADPAPDSGRATSRRPAMLVVTHLDVWLLTGKRGVRGAGNQDMYNTLLGYVAAGYDVHVLTTSHNLSELDRIGEHIRVHRIPLPGYAAIQRLRAAIRRNRPSQGDCASPPPSPTGSAAPPGQRVRFWAAFAAAAFLHALRLGRQLRFELVYGYEIFGAQTGYVLARLWRVPCVTRFQGTELSPMLDRPSRLWMRNWTWLLGYKMPADLIVMANDGTEGDRLLRWLSMDPQRIGFWMNGVDKQRVLRPELDVTEFRRRVGVPDDHAFVLTTVRLVHWKRYDRALRALATVRRRSDRFTYLIIGEGPLRESLEVLARDLGLADRVRFLGQMPHEQVVEYVNACDIYLSVNDLSNLGNPLIEATLCGRCIVTLNNGATRDLITHDVNGLLLPPDDSDALADALCRLIDSPAERGRLAAGACQRARSLQTWTERMELELATLHRLTDGRTLYSPNTADAARA